jgi:hypothetical protein
VPQPEAEALRRDAIWDEENTRWRKREPSRKTLIEFAEGTARPKRAFGLSYPTAKSPKKQGKPSNEEVPIQLSLGPVRSRIKPGPLKLKTRSIEDSILVGFQETYVDTVLEVGAGKQPMM